MKVIRISIKGGSDYTIKHSFPVTRIIGNANIQGAAVYDTTNDIIVARLPSYIYGAVKIDFKSYNGYPNSANLRIHNASTSDVSVLLLFDTTPNTKDSINDHYFEVIS